MKGCSNLTILTPEETQAELNRLGLTAETASQPTEIELLVEFEQGRIKGDEYQRLCKQHGYAARL